MNWLWVILGAIGGALLLQESGGLLLGAILGGIASRLSRSRRSEWACEKRLRGLEQRLARLERGEAATDEIEPAEAVSLAPATEPDQPLATVEAIPPAVKSAAVQAPAIPRSAHLPTPPKSAPTYSNPSWAREPNPWISRLLSGNLLAKVGVVLLFFGAASGLKMAADYGLFPPGVRLLLAALAGVALIAHYRQPASRSWLDGTLLFGVPVVAAMVQGALGYERDYLALTALLVGLYYLSLAALTQRSDNPVLPRAFVALAITCLTAAIPLYFGASVTAVFWALEGAAVLVFGLHQQRQLPCLRAR